MAPDIKDEELIRNYLLGDVSDQERESIESRLMSDREFSDLARVIESMLVEDYVEAALQDQDRERLEKLLVATPQGAEQVRFARALKEYVSERTASAVTATPNRPRLFATSRLPRWALVAAALLLLTLGVGTWRAFFFESEISKGRNALSSAYRERPVDVLTTGIAHIQRTQRRGSEVENSDPERLHQAELILKNAETNDPGPDSFHAVGYLYIARRDFEQAIEYLNKAVGLEPDGAKIHNDLGAAYFELGNRNRGPGHDDRPQEFELSMQHLKRAIEIEPGFIEAHFNLALLYEATLPPDQAADEWREFLRQYPASLWADEARSRLRALENK